MVKNLKLYIEGYLMTNFYSKNKSIVAKYGFARRIGLDFDDCCADADTEDYFTIGKPIDGAIDVVSNLRDLGWYIVIWSARTNSMLKEELSQAPTEYPKLMIGMLDWLERYDFPYDEIWMGAQKPPCARFIDDRVLRLDKSNPNCWAEILVEIQKNRGIEWKRVV
jgi:hypothetical protein